MAILEIPLDIIQRCTSIPSDYSFKPVLCDSCKAIVEQPGTGVSSVHLQSTVFGNETQASKFTIAGPIAWYSNDSPSTSVFEAQLESDGDTEEVRTVVCKVAAAGVRNYMRGIRLEASLYQDRLAGLQGVHVPRFVGLFEGVASGDRPYGVLVTVYEGCLLPRELAECNVDIRRRVLDALIAIHKAGVAHGDVIQDNIVLKDNGTPMLIDFDCGEVHECTFIENSITFHAPMPEAGDIGCYEIWQAAQEADVWPSSHFPYYSGLANEGRIPVGDILLGRQHIIAFQLERGVGVEHVEENADRVLRHLREWIDFRTLHDGEVPLHQVP